MQGNQVLHVSDAFVLGIGHDRMFSLVRGRW
jgi:hypothetical protein